jgi:hypothetical protein
VAGLAILFWILPEPSKDDTKNDEASKLSRVDFAGAFALVGAVLTGSLALDLASKGVPMFYSITMILAFLLFVASFIAVEKYYAKEPVMPLGLISRRDVLTSCSIVALQAAGQFGVSSLTMVASYRLNNYSFYSPFPFTSKSSATNLCRLLVRGLFLSSLAMRWEPFSAEIAYIRPENTKF